VHALTTATTTAAADAFDRWCTLVEEALAAADDDDRWTAAFAEPVPFVDLGLEPAVRAARLARVLALSNEVQLRRMTLLTELVSVTEERRALAVRGRALVRYLTDGGRAGTADSPQA
jgi:hypothetical protein